MIRWWPRIVALISIIGGLALADDATIKIVAVGDIMLGTDYPDDRLAENDGADFLSVVGPVLRDADITLGNLEGVIMAGGTAEKTCSSPEACFLFRSPPHYAGYLREAGFDAISLANNHALDFGEHGRSATMLTLDTYRIHHSGRRGDIATWRHGELTIAFIAFSPTRLSYLLNDIPAAEQQVAQLASAHDLVIVSFHGGAEGQAATRLPFEEEFYFGETRGEVVRFARRVIDAGADLVLGHGPHVVRAMELYRDRLIAYSLGNFATHFGVSVDGMAGWAPVLLAEVDQNGVFVGGRIHSALQQRPEGPRWDPQNRAYTLIRTLTVETFGPDMFVFDEGGTFSPGVTRLP